VVGDELDLQALIGEVQALVSRVAERHKSSGGIGHRIAAGGRPSFVGWTTRRKRRPGKGSKASA
jgi:hypothetical protein